MGMFSGCYLVLCGNEIVGHLIATLRLWRPPLDHYWNKDHWAARGLEPTSCLEVKRLPESAESRMIDRRLEEVSLLRTLTPPREATFCLEGRFRQGAGGLRKMRCYTWCLIKSDKWQEKKAQEIDEAKTEKEYTQFLKSGRKKLDMPD